MPNEMMKKIEEFRKYMNEEVNKVQTRDEIVNGLFARLWKTVDDDLQTIWFYHEALVDRTNRDRMRRS